MSRRMELGIVGLFVALNVTVPLAARELYPFSSFHGFVDSARRYCDYRVVGPEGEPLSTAAFGLHRNYYGNGGYSVNLPEPHRGGVPLPPTLDRFGEVPSEARVRTHVRERLERSHPKLDWVRVTQRVVGAVDDDRVGVVRTHTWRIRNPARSGVAPR